MALNRVNITKAAIDAFTPAPIGKRAYYHDSKTMGLVVSVTDKGTKSFLHQEEGHPGATRETGT